VHTTSVVCENTVRLVPVMVPMALPPVLQALLPARAEVVWCVGGRAIACLERVVASALELSRALPSGWYLTHYRPLLEPVDRSEVSPPD
jgi:hypothetical protein